MRRRRPEPTEPKTIDALRARGGAPWAVFCTARDAGERAARERASIVGESESLGRRRDSFFERRRHRLRRQRLLGTEIERGSSQRAQDRPTQSKHLEPCALRDSSAAIEGDRHAIVRVFRARAYGF